MYYSRSEILAELTASDYADCYEPGYCPKCTRASMCGPAEPCEWCEERIAAAEYKDEINGLEETIRDLVEDLEQELDDEDHDWAVTHAALTLDKIRRLVVEQNAVRDALEELTGRRE